MALAALLAIAVSACGDAPRLTKSLVAVAAHEGLDARQQTVALQVVHREAARPGRSIAVAMAKLVDGPIRNRIPSGAVPLAHWSGSPSSVNSQTSPPVALHKADAMAQCTP
jgi:hypothetical protein